MTDPIPDLAERLVQAAEDAIADIYEFGHSLNWTPEARAVVVTVLRELASVASARGTAASESVAAELRPLADEIERTSR